MAHDTTTAAAGPSVRRLVTSWQTLLILGLVTLVLGILVLGWPTATVAVISVLFGAQFLVLGIVGIARAIGGHETSRVLHALLGVLCVVIGVLVLRHLFESVVVLTVLFGLTWLISAIIDLVIVIGDRARPARGWAVGLDVLTIVASIVILAYPGASLVLLTMLIGTWLIVWGVLTSINAFLVRRAVAQE